MTPTTKSLIMLQFHNGDSGQAMELARLMADLEDQHSQFADLALVARYDTGHNLSTIKYVSRKFNTHTIRSPRRETGWPMGCNGLFFGGLEWVYHKMAAGQIPHYQTLFVCEADSLPLTKDWIIRLRQSWLSAQKARPIYVAGALVPDNNGQHPHINGGACILSGDLKFLRWLAKTAGGANIKAGWDWMLANDFQTWGWSNIEPMRSLWRIPTMTEDQIKQWRAEGIVYIHGCKDRSGLTHIRKLLL